MGFYYILGFSIVMGISIDLSFLSVDDYNNHLSGYLYGGFHSHNGINKWDTSNIWRFNDGLMMVQ